MSRKEDIRLADSELLEQIVAKHPAAVAELYDRFAKLLYGIIVSVVKDTDDAEDLLQDVFVQVWRSAHTYQYALGTPKQWLIKMAHNRAIDLLRSKRNQQKKAEVRPDQDGEPYRELAMVQATDNPLEDAIRTESRYHLSKALAKLSEAQGMLIRMSFLEGFSHQEISEKTGVPLGTVKTHIRNGMIKLRSLLGFIEERA